MPQKTDMFWTAGHCGREEVSGVVVLLQPREPSIPTDRVPDALKQFARPKRDREKVWSHATSVRAADKRRGEVIGQYHWRGCKGQLCIISPGYT